MGLLRTSSTVTSRMSTRCREPRHLHARGHARLLVSRYIRLYTLTRTLSDSRTSSTVTTRMSTRCRGPRLSTLCSSVAVRPKKVCLPA